MLTLLTLLAAWFGTAAAWNAVPGLAAIRAADTSSFKASMLLEEAQGPEALLRLCAATDRGQRCTSAERALIASLVRDMEGDAPRADATMLNGNWRLLYASTPSVYRSSPFFWAFKQALAGSTTPIAIPGGGVQPGDAVAEAIYAITDGIPFYNLGAVYQIISGVCGVDTACEVEYAEGTAPSDGASSADEPSDGTSDRAAFATATSFGGAPGSTVRVPPLAAPQLGSCTSSGRA